MYRQENKGQASSQKSTVAFRRWVETFFDACDKKETETDGGMGPRPGRWARGALLALVAASFCRVPLLFSVNPLGIALLCSAKTGVGWILVGLLFGWLGAADEAWMSGNNRLFVAGVAAALLLRLLIGLVLIQRTEEKQRNIISLAVSYIKRPIGKMSYILTLHGGGHSSPEQTSTPPQDTALPPLFGEPLRYRVMVALLAAIVPSVGGSIVGGYAYYDLYGALTYLLLTPALVPLFSGVWHDVRQGLGKQVGYLSGLAALFFFACYCTRSVSLVGVSLVLTVTSALALWVVSRHGVLAGGIVALLGGLSLDIRCVPMLATMVVVYALMQPLLRGVASGAAVLVGLLVAMLTGGVTFLWQTMPSLLVGTLIFSVACRVRDAYVGEKGKAASPQKPSPSSVDETEQQLLCEQGRNEAICTRISATAGAFGSLAEIFHALDEARGHPDAVTLRRMMDEIFDEHCPRCLYRSLCWTDEYSATAAGVRAMSRQLAAKPEASVVDKLPEALRRRCPCLVGMMEELNIRIKRKLLEQQSGVGSEQFARSYDSISHLLRDLLHEDNGSAEEEFRLRVEQSRAVSERLAKEGITPRQVCVLGERRLRVRMTGISPAALTVPREQLRQMLGEICGVAFDRIRYDGSGEGCLSLVALPTLQADYAHLCSSADEMWMTDEGGKAGGRRPCGDSLRVFEREDGMLYVLLCDGMGSGRSAALTSGPSAVFLERVLSAGVSAETALRMLNHYLRSRAPAEECSTPVDLLAFDLYTGKARFIKSGAAPSVVVRDGRIFHLASHTVPLGILQAVDAQVIPFEFKEGDLVLLMSDGISDVDDMKGGDDGWLGELLSTQHAQREPEAVVSTLIAAARSHGSHDDASAVCLRISRTPTPNEAAQTERSA